MSTIVNEQEFMNYTEIVNDVIHKLHSKDITLLESLPLQTLFTTQREFANHIRNFYHLWHPDNPLTIEKGMGPDSLALDIMQTVWECIQNKPTNTYA